MTDAPELLPAQGGGITAPATGTSDDGGTFHGTIAIIGADFNPQIGPVILIRIKGALVRGSMENGSTPAESVNLSFEPVEMTYADHVDTDEDCIRLELRPASQFETETKRTIQFDPSRLRTERLPGPANIIADLICANDEAVEAGWEPSEPPQ